MTDAAELDPHLGVVVGGRFRVEELLGAGGMARVYRATQLSLGEDVAVKFLSRVFSAEPELRERFRREALALARLRHPGVVSIVDFGDHDGELYIAMELLRGRTLADVMEEGGGRLPVVRLAPVFDQLLSVLEAAHATGIVHRDVKPSNVVLLDSADRGEHVKLLDFGLAHVPTEGPKLTQTGVVQGTPAYMSPEQCKGELALAPSDVYSVGVVLYEAICGRAPFDGGGAPILMSQHMFVDPPPMSEIAGGPVPAGLEEVVRQALRKAPADRPTVAELRVMLTAAFRGTDPVTLAEQATEERRRDAALTRSERALTTPRREGPGLEAAEAARVVALWTEDATRADALRATLGVRGIKAVRSAAGDAAAWAGASAILCDHALGPEVVQAARARGAPPICVFGVPVAAVTAWVRAGASDAAPEGADDAEIGRKVERVIRRGR